MELGGSIASERSPSLSERVAGLFVKWGGGAESVPLVNVRFVVVEEVGWYITLLAVDTGVSIEHWWSVAGRTRSVRHFATHWRPRITYATGVVVKQRAENAN